jgi:endonuclease/exonuclease/phosphatase family metal-dependent hydrolase
MRYIFYSLLLSLLVIAKPFDVATYNLHNLFDAIESGEEYSEYTKASGWNESVVNTKLNHISEVICDINAEVIALQEVENRYILAQLQQRLKEVGCRYNYTAITHTKKSPIQVGLLSKIPIVNQISHSVLGEKSRDILQVTLKVKGIPFELFINHWKAKTRKGYESKRHLYAKALQTSIERLPKGRDYIILGDFNSNYSLDRLPQHIDNTSGVIGLHHYLKLTKNNLFVTQEKLYTTNNYHLSLWSELPLKDRWSMYIYGRYFSPDHIILPSTLFDKQGISYLDNSFRVFKEPYLFTKRGYINRTVVDKGKLKGYSDHLPLIASFTVAPFQAKASPQSNRIIHTTTQLYLHPIYNEVLLKDVVVLLKYKQSAVIKQKDERGIFVYGNAQNLKVGYRYDILVKRVTSYKGLQEITKFDIVKNSGKVKDLDNYFLSSKMLQHRDKLKQNETIHNVIGTYNHGKLTIGNVTLPLHIKEKNVTLKDGVKLKITYVHIGYYKKLQFVLYSTNDFQVLKE